MAIALVVTATIGATGSSDSITTAGVNTTGASLLIVCVSSFNNSNATGVSDSKGNTWTALTRRDAGVPQYQRIWYAVNPTVGTGHTFSYADSTGHAPALVAAAYSGTATSSPFDVENGAGVTGTSLQTGSVTPANAGSLIVTALNLNLGSGTATIDSGFTVQVTNSNNGVHDGIIYADLIETSIVAKNPTWTPSGSAQMAAAIAVFKPFPSVVPITETLSDSFTFSDALAILVPILGFALSDTLVLSDFVASTYGLMFSEGLTLSDLLASGLSLPVSGADSLSLSDAVIFLIGVGLGRADTLTFSDVLNIATDVRRSLGDNILLSDFLVALVANLPSYSDTFGLSDAIQLGLSLGMSQSDSLNLVDAVQLAIVNNLILVKSDSLLLSDNLSLSLSGPGNLDQYIRHWLNDVPR